MPDERKEIRETKKHFWIISQGMFIKFKKRRNSYVCKNFFQKCECKCLNNERADFKILSLNLPTIPKSSFIVNEKFSPNFSTFRLSNDGILPIDLICENLYVNCDYLDYSPKREIYIIHEDTFYNRDTIWNNLSNTVFN